MDVNLIAHPPVYYRCLSVFIFLLQDRTEYRKLHDVPCVLNGEKSKEVSKSRALFVACLFLPRRAWNTHALHVAPKGRSFCTSVGLLLISYFEPSSSVGETVDHSAEDGLLLLTQPLALAILRATHLVCERQMRWPPKRRTTNVSTGSVGCLSGRAASIDLRWAVDFRLELLTAKLPRIVHRQSRGEAPIQ
jgi:hypothetical protein